MNYLDNPARTCTISNYPDAAQDRLFEPDSGTAYSDFPEIFLMGEGFRVFGNKGVSFYICFYCWERKESRIFFP